MMRIRQSSLRCPTVILLAVLLVSGPCPLYVLAQDTSGTIPQLQATASDLSGKLEALQVEKALLEQKLIRIQKERDTYEKEVFDILSGDFLAESKESVRRIVEMKEAEHRQELLRLREGDASWKKIHGESLQKIAELEKALDEYQAQLSRMEEEQRQLQSRWQFTQNQLTENKDNLPRLLAEERAPLQQKIQNLEAQKKTSTDEMVALKARLSGTEKALANEEAARAQLKKELDALRGAKVSTEKDLNARLKTLQSDLESRNGQLADQLTEKERLLKEAHGRHDALSRSHQNLSQSLEAKEKENAALQQSASETQKDFQNRTDMLLQQIAEKDQRIQDLAKDVKALQTQRDSQETAGARMTQELKTLRTQLEDEQRSFDIRLQDSIAQEQKRTETAKTQWQSVQSVLEVREVELKNLRRHADALNEKLLTQNQEFERLEKQFQESAQRLTEATAAFHNEKLQLQSDIQRLSGDLQKKDKLLQQRQEEAKRLQHEADTQAQAWAATRQTLEAEKEKALLRYTQDTQQLQQRVSALEQDIRRQVAIISEKEKTVTEQNVRIKTFEERVALLDKQRQEADQKNSAALSQVQDLTDQIKAVEQSIPAKVDEARRPLENTIQELEGRVAALQQDNEEKLRAINALKESRDALSGEIKSRDSRLEELDKNNRLLRDDIALLKKSIPEQTAQARLPLQQAIDALTQKNAALNDEIHQKEEHLKRQNEGLAVLQKRLDSVEGQTQDLAGQNADLVKELEQIKTSVPIQIAAVREPLEKELQHKAALLKTWEDKSASQHNAYTELHKEHGHLGAEFQQSQQKVQQLADQVGSLTSELESTRKDIPSRIAKAEKPLLEKMSALEGQVAEKAKMLSARDAAVRESDTRIRKLQEKVQQHEASHSQLTQAYDKLKEAYAHLEASIPERVAQAMIPLEKTIAQAHEDIGRMKETLDGKEQALSGSVKHIHSLEDEVKELNGALAQSREQTSIFQSQWKDLKKQYAALEADVPERVQAAKRPLEENMATLEIALEEQRTLLKQVQQSLNEKNQVVERLTGSVKQLEDTKQKLDAEKKTLTLRIQDLEKQWPDKLAKAKQPLKKTIAELNRRLEEERAAMEKERASAARLQKDLAAKDGYLRQLQNELKVSQTEKETLDQHLTQVQQAIPSHVAKATEPLQENIRRLSGELQNFHAQLEAYKKDIRAYQEKEQSWMASARILEKDKALLEKSLRQSEQDLGAARDTVKKSAAEYAGLQQEIPDRIQAAVDPLKKNIAELNALIPVKMEEARAPLLKEISEYKERLARQEDQHAVLKDEYSGLQAASMALQKTIQALTAEKDAAEARLAQAQQTAQVDKAALQMEIRKLSEDHYQLTESAQAAQAQWQSSLSDNRKQLQAMEKAHASAQKDITRLSSDLEKSRAALEHLQRDKSAVDDRLAQRETVIESQKEKLSALERKMTAHETAMRQQMEENERLQSVAARQSEELKSLQASIPGQIARVREPLTQELARHTAALTARDEDIQTKVKVIADLQKEREKLGAQLKEAQALRGQTLTQVEVLQKQWQDEQQVSHQTAQNLAVAEKRITDLDATIKRLHDKNLDYENQMHALESVMAALKNSIPDTVAKAKDPLVKHIEDLQKDLGVQKDALSAAREEQNHIKGERNTLSRNLERALSEQDHLRKAVEQMEAALPEQMHAARAPLELELTEVKETVARLESTIAEKDETLRISKESIARLEKAVEQRDAEAARLTQQLQKTVSQSQDDIKSVQTQLARLASEKELVDGQLADSQALIKEKTKVLSAFERQLQDNAKAIRSREEERVQLEKKWQDTVKALQVLEAGVPQTVAAAKEPLLKEMNQWKAKLSARDQELLETNKALSALSKQYKDSQVRIQELEQSRKELDKQAAALKDELQIRNAHVRSKEEQLAQASTRMQELQQTIQDLQNQNSGYEKNAHSLQDALRNLEEGIPGTIAKAEAPLKQQIAHLQEQMRIQDENLPQRLAEVRQPLLKEMEQLRGELEARRGTITQLEAQRESLEKDRKTYASQLNASQDQVARLKHELDEKYEALESMKTSLPEQIAAAQAPLAASVEDLTRQLNARAQENTRLTAELATLDRHLKQKEETLAVSTNELHKIKNILEEKNSVLQDLETRIPREVAKAEAPLKHRIASLEESFQQQNEALPQQLAAAKQPLLDRAEELQAEIAQLQSQYQKTAEERETYTTRLASSEKEAAWLKQELEKSLAAFAALEKSVPEQLASVKVPLETSVKELRADITAREKDIALRQKEIAQLQSQYKNTAEEREAYAARLVSSEKEIAQLKQELDKSRASFKALEKSVPEQLASVKVPLETSVKELRTQIAAREKEIALRQKEITQLQFKYQKTAEEREAYATRLASSEKEATRLKEELDKSRDAFAALEKSVPERLASVKVPLETSVNELRADITAREKEIALRQKEITQLQSQYQKTAEEREVYATRLASSEKEAARLKEELDKSRDAFAALEKSVPERLASAKAPLEASVEETRRKLEAAVESNEELTSQMTQLQSQLAAKEKLIAASNAKTAELNAALNDKVSRVDTLNQKLQQQIKANEDQAVILSNLQKQAVLKDDLLLAAGRDAEVLNQQNTDVHDQLIALQREYQDLEKRSGALQKELAEERLRLSGKEDELKQALQKMQSADQLVMSLKETNGQYAAELNTLKKTMADLQASIPSQIQQAKLPLEKALQDLTTQLDSAEGETKRQAAALQDSQEENAALKALRASLIEEKAVLESSLAASDERLARLADEKAAMDKQLAEHAAQISRQEDALAQSQQALTIKAEDVGAYEAKLAAMAKQMEKLESGKKALEMELGTVQAARDEATEQVHALQNDLAAAQSTIHDQTESLRTASEDAAKLNDLVKTLHAQEAAYEDELTSLHNDIAVLKKSVPTQITEARAPLLQEVDRLAAEVRQQAEAHAVELAREKSAMQSAIVEWQQRHDDKVKEIGHLTEDKEGLRQRFVKLESELGSAAAEITALREHQTALESSLQEKVSLLEHSTDTVALLTADIKTRQSRIDAVEQEKKALAKALSDKEEALASLRNDAPAVLASAKAPLESQITGLKKALAQAEGHARQAQMELDRVHAEHVKVVKDRADLEHRFMQAQTAFETLNSQSSQLEQTYQKQLEDARKEAAAIQNTYVQLKEEHAALREAFAAEQKSRIQFASDMETLKTTQRNLHNEHQQELASQVAPLEERVQALDTALNALRAELREKDASLKAGSEANTGLLEEIRNLRAAMANDKATWERQSGEKDQAYTALEADLQTLAAERNAALKTLEGLTNENARLQQDVLRLALEKNNDSEAAAAHIQVLEKRLSALQEQSAAALSQERKSTEALQAKLTHWQARSQELEAANASIEKQKLDLERTLASLEKDIDGLRKDMPAKMEQAKAPLSDMIAELKVQVVTLEEEAARKSAEAVQVQKRANLVEQELEKLKKDKALFEKTVSLLNDQVSLTGQALNQQVELLKAQNQSLAQKVSDYEQQLANAKKNLEAAQGRSEQEEMQTLIRQLQEEITSARELIPSR